MNRKIKFRVWDTESNRVISHDEWNRWWDNCEGGTMDAYINSRYFIAMQYTGLKDKNGVEIYEGDILESWYHDPTQGYKTNKTKGAVKGVRGGFIIYENEQVAYPMIGLVRKVEVIGNIYENPELIERKGGRD